MVTYNQERTIAQAIESVIEQRVSFPFEVIIGEDCSTDTTRSIVERYAAAHPRLIRTRLATQNQGGKKNFLGVFGDCGGEFVTILEGDDYWTSPDKLQKQVDALDANPGWAICFHPARCDYADSLTGPELLPASWDRRESTIEDLLDDCFIPTSGVMFRNKLFPIPSWLVELGDLGDWPLHLLTAGHGAIGFLPEPMSVYRVHSGGVWTRRSVVQRLVPILEMLSHIDHHYDGAYRARIEAHRARIVTWLCSEVDHARRQASAAAEALEPAQLQCQELQRANQELWAIVDRHERRNIRSRLLRLRDKVLRHLPGAPRRPKNNAAPAPSSDRAAA
jgi:glycosyltransferase involved in cell wall biosynthesis